MRFDFLADRHEKPYFIHLSTIKSTYFWNGIQVSESLPFYSVSLPRIMWLNTDVVEYWGKGKIVGLFGFLDAIVYR